MLLFSSPLIMYLGKIQMQDIGICLLIWYYIWQSSSRNGKIIYHYSFLVEFSSHRQYNLLILIYSLIRFSAWLARLQKISGLVYRLCQIINLISYAIIRLHEDQAKPGPAFWIFLSPKVWRIYCFNNEPKNESEQSKPSGIDTLQNCR